MNNMQEESVLEKLGCIRWSDLTKDKVPTLMELLPFMEPRIADKALDVVLSVPELAKQLKEYSQQMLGESLKMNNEITRASAIADQEIIKSLIMQLDRDDLSADERREIRQDLKELSDRLHSSGSENRNWISHVAEFAQNHDNVLLAAAGVIVGGFLGIFIGSKIDK